MASAEFLPCVLSIYWFFSGGCLKCPLSWKCWRLRVLLPAAGGAPGDGGTDERMIDAMRAGASTRIGGDACNPPGYTDRSGGVAGGLGPSSREGRACMHFPRTILCVLVDRITVTLYRTRVCSHRLVGTPRRTRPAGSAPSPRRRFRSACHTCCAPRRQVAPLAVEEGSEEWMVRATMQRRQEIGKVEKGSRRCAGRGNCPRH